MQVHWDVGAEVGVMQRFVTDAGSGARSPGPGPVGEVHAHVALIPMLRAGPYLAHDISPGPAIPAREVTDAGLRENLLRALLSPPGRLTRDWIRGPEPRGGIGVVFTGGMYSDAQPFCACAVAARGGKDSFALSLSVGVSFDP